MSPIVETLPTYVSLDHIVNASPTDVQNVSAGVPFPFLALQNEPSFSPFEILNYEVIQSSLLPGPIILDSPTLPIALPGNSIEGSPAPLNLPFLDFSHDSWFPIVDNPVPSYPIMEWRDVEAALDAIDLPPAQPLPVEFGIYCERFNHRLVDCHFCAELDRASTTASTSVQTDAVTSRTVSTQTFILGCLDSKNFYVSSY